VKVSRLQLTLIYQDQLTESVVLRPCKTKTAEVTFQLTVSSFSLGHSAFCKDRMTENSPTKLSKISRPQGHNWKLCMASPDMDRAKVSKEPTKKT